MKIVTLKGNIELLTGLHIGGGDDTMKIGGIDKEVVKIYDKKLKREVPYIPGSSLKGKIRSLIEIKNRLVMNGGDVFSSKYLDAIDNKEKKEKAVNILKIFGDSNNENSEIGITRAIFYDAYLNKETKESFLNEEIELKEAKYENSINRLTGKASNPRQIERVPAGIEFEFEIKIKVLDDDNEEKLKEIIEEGLELLENDYLGGNGSRGYGRVKINYEWK
jgi:CRISPR-associated protein Csm3